MNEINCENVLLTKLAEIDGELAEIDGEQINSHLASCENCRLEIQQLKNTDNLLKRQARREQDADLWSAIETRIGAKKTSPLGWKLLVPLGGFLVMYKLIEMIPEHDFGFAFKLVPLVLIVALFAFLKENPFKINAELAVER